MMTNKDCKDLEETVRKINPKGPNDLEEQIRILQFRNEKLHLHNQKIEQENIHSKFAIKIKKSIM